MKRICFVGASTTEGLGDASGRGWVGNLTIVKQQKVVCYNLGVRGQTIFQIAERALAECNSRILNYQNSGIVLGCTLNEIAKLENKKPRAEQKDILSCYSALIANLQKTAPLIVIGPPPVLHSKMPFYSAASGLSLNFHNPDIKEIDILIHKKCTEMSVPYISIFKPLLKTLSYTDGLEINDGLHTDGTGYIALAKIIENNKKWKSFA